MEFLSFLVAACLRVSPQAGLKMHTDKRENIMHVEPWKFGWQYAQTPQDPS